MKTEIKERSTDKLTVTVTLTVEERDKMQLDNVEWMKELIWSVKRKVLQAEFHAPNLHDATTVCHTLIHVDDLEYIFEILFDSKEFLMEDIETIEYQANQDRGVLEDISRRGGNYTFEGLQGQIEEACLEREYLCKKMRETLEGK